MSVPNPRYWEDGEEAANLPTAAILNDEWLGAMQWLTGVTRPLIVADGAGGDTLPSGTFSAGIAFNTNTVIRGGMVHNTVTNNSRIQVPDAGTYRAIFHWGTGNGAAAGRWYTDAVLNGTATVLDRASDTGSNTGNWWTSVALTCELAASDYVEFKIQNSASGATANVGTGVSLRPRVMIWLDQPA